MKTLTQDWPPADDFAEIFPALFTDFENALPFPRYTRRKGFMNLVSRFPADLVIPDLGPKMYNAHASDDNLHGKGTTRLHLDITDAV
jgi:[histone H3]-dimethyl-L-lysine9 demethylase